MKKFLISIFVVTLWFLLIGNVSKCQNYLQNDAFLAPTTVSSAQIQNKKNLISNYKIDTKIIAGSNRNQPAQNFGGFDSIMQNKNKYDALIFNIKFKLLTIQNNRNKRLLFAIHPNAP